MFLASMHLYQMLIHPGDIGPYESADGHTASDAIAPRNVAAGFIGQECILARWKRMNVFKFLIAAIVLGTTVVVGLAYAGAGSDLTQSSAGGAS